MKKKYRLKQPIYSFERKGMIIYGEQKDKKVNVYAYDFINENISTMSKSDIVKCMINGQAYIWEYDESVLERINMYDVSTLEYELLNYFRKEGYSYIARDKNTDMTIFGSKPHRVDIVWQCDSYFLTLQYFNDLFSFCDWGDREPLLIQDILDKYEVIENEKI